LRTGFLYTTVGETCRACEGEAYTGFWWRNLRERDHLGDPGVDGRIILRWVIMKLDVGVRIGSSWLRRGQVAGTKKNIRFP
jgi:hypothetical protein